MKDEKIFENEKLSEEELEKVVGGTNGEYKELRDLLPEIKRIGKYPALGGFHDCMKPNEVSDWLKENLNIYAKIDNGSWYNPLNSAGNPNVYSRNGQSLTHAQVVAEVKKFLGQ